jgi:hypothetical protein
MKRIAAIAFSFFFLYAGAVQALTVCLHHHSHFDHAAEDHHSDSHALTSHDDSRSPSWPAIHCPSTEDRIGPAVLVASVKLSRLDRMQFVHAFFLPETAASAFRDSAWLQALFRRILTFSLPNEFARHLFLSVLQI